MDWAYTKGKNTLIIWSAVLNSAYADVIVKSEIQQHNRVNSKTLRF